MPRQLIAVGPRQPVLQEYEDGPLPPGGVRIRSEFSTPKHGTEMARYRGASSWGVRRYDGEWGMFVPEEKPNPGAAFPMPLGNMTVGTVTQVGAEATQYHVGDRVFGHLPIQETHTVVERQIEGHVPDGMDPHAIACWDPAEFALGAVRDGQVRLGDRVAVFGLGAIGLLVAQMARLSGAAFVAVVDPIEKRRDLAVKHGATVALDPTQCDASMEIRTATEKQGVDIAIEASGNYRALHEAIRCCGMRGRVTPLAFYQGEAKGLDLGDEWHLNAVTVLSSRACTEPNRDYPLWDTARIRRTCWDMLRDGRLNVQGIIDPVVHFNDSAEAYRAIDERPQESIKLGVVYE